ncbi:hypothetical protein [Duganella sp. CY15W]
MAIQFHRASTCSRCAT